MRMILTVALCAAFATSTACARDDAQDGHAAHAGHATHAGDAAHAAHADPADPASHADHAAPAADAGARFATDAVLRAQMAGIRADLDALAHHEMGHMTQAQAAEYAADVEARVQTIIAECQLPPEADAALHAIIVPLLRDAIALKTTPADTAPVASMRAALADYARRFDDPDAAAQD